MAIEGSMLRNRVASSVTARSAIVVATMIVAGGCGGSATGPAPAPPPPATILIEKLGADPAHVLAGDPFPDSIRVVVHDGSGAPRASQTVTFAVRTGGGSVSPSTVTTGADGRAAARFITGTLVEQNTATASLPSGKSVSFSTSTIPGPAAAISISGAPVIVLDSGASSTVEATVQDRNGNAIPGASLHLTVRDGVTASVSGTNVVTGIAPGQTMVTASSGAVLDSMLVVVAHAAGPVFSMALPGFNVAPDTTFTASVVVDMRQSQQLLGSATLSLRFDPSVAAFVSWTAGSDAAGVQLNDSAATGGTIVFAVASANGLSARAELVRLTFRAAHTEGKAGTFALDASEVAGAQTFDNLLSRTVAVRFPIAIRQGELP
jgi:hypothetical protein